MKNFPSPKYISISAPDGGHINIAVYDAPISDEIRDANKDPIILIHGWPELAYSWKNQMEVLAETGRRVLAIDLKGFGRSDTPHNVAQYDMRHITDDLANLLGVLEIKRAIFCGHDWGGAIVWAMGVLKPDLVCGVISICTPHLPAPPVAPISILKKRFGDLHYFVQFQEPDIPEQTFTGHEELLFNICFRKPPARHKWPNLIPDIYDLPGRLKKGAPVPIEQLVVSEESIQFYIEAFQKSGFHGGINIYRNVDQNWAYMKEKNLVIEKPCLWVGAELDIFIPPEAAAPMKELIPNLTQEVIPKCGHWVMWEQPKKLNTILSTWLEKNFG